MAATDEAMQHGQALAPGHFAVIDRLAPRQSMSPGERYLHRVERDQPPVLREQLRQFGVGCIAQ
jgi:hypothetical protein